jgi:thiamine biosynthesis lipoprotein
MPEPTRTNRREFLYGRSAVEALGDAVIGHSDLPAPSAADVGRTYLQSISRQAMACEFEILLPQCGPAVPVGQTAALTPASDVSDGDHRTTLAPAEAALAALDLIDRLEDQLSIYRDTTEIMAINRRATREAVVVEPRLFDLLARAVELFRATGGAFDITAGPLSKVWGFYRRQGRMPDDAQVAEALALVGSEQLLLDREHRTLRFAQSGMELNLGAIGKGYALDRAAELLQTSGVADFAIHGGHSSVIARGHRNSATDAGWSVALRHPLKPEVRLAEFRLFDQALGTSGSGTQFFHYQGQRYGHILDPRTGWPADKVLSATVIAPTAEQADALSTAFYILGLDQAREFCASRPDIAVVLVTAQRAGEVELHPLNLPDDAWQRLH